MTIIQNTDMPLSYPRTQEEREIIRNNVKDAGDNLLKIAIDIIFFREITTVYKNNIKNGAQPIDPEDVEKMNRVYWTTDYSLTINYLEAIDRLSIGLISLQHLKGEPPRKTLETAFNVLKKNYGEKYGVSTRGYDKIESIRNKVIDDLSQAIREKISSFGCGLRLAIF